MSGIVGICHAGGEPVDPPQVERMLEASAYRGPDGRSAWHEGPVALGHLMLWTTPESLHEHLPLYDPQAGLAITADARIDNREELITALGLAERAREGLSDSELILAAYARWGEECPSHLLGDFAFAIWDANSRRLFCARDHFGVRPFYYSQREGRFAFASDVKALLALPWISREIDERSVAGYLALLFDEDRTAYQDVHRLPPAHTLVFDHTGTALRRYWALDPNRELRLGSDEEYAEAFLECFTEAVRCRLRSAYQIGSALSGGLDSSSITCLARKLLSDEGRGRRLHTFSGTFERFPECDEQTYIRTVLEQGGLEAHLVPVDGLSPFQTYLGSVSPEEGPFPGYSFYLHWGLYHAAHEHGVRVVLDGHDGDTVVSHGYGLLDHLARRGRWISLWREVRALTPEGQSPLPRLRTIIRDLLPDGLRRLWRRFRCVTEAARLLSDSPPLAPDFAHRTGILDRLRSAERERTRYRSPREAHCGSITFPGHAIAFEAAGKLGSSFGLEPRFPFFDRRVVELCVALPAEQKLRLGWTRYVLRSAMRGILPEPIRERRSKSDLTACFLSNFHDLDRLLVSGLIQREEERLTAFLDIEELGRIHEQCFAQQLAPRRLWMPVWSAASLAAWLAASGACVPPGPAGGRRV